MQFGLKIVLRGRVVFASGRHYEVETADGRRLRAFPKSRREAFACGDLVEIDAHGAVVSMQPRTSLFYRSDALREKIIAHASDLMIVVVDESKLVSKLGRFALPVEVDRFGFSITAKQIYDVLRACGIAKPDVQLRRKGDGLDPFVTDGGHYILDCACGAIPDAAMVDYRLKALPGVVEHGLFIGLARVVIVGEDTEARVLEL